MTRLTRETFTDISLSLEHFSSLRQTSREIRMLMYPAPFDAAVTFVAVHRVYYRVRGDPRPLMKRLANSCQRDVDVTKFAIM